MSSPDSPLCSIVIPLFNEERHLPGLHEAIRLVCVAEDLDYEIVFVDDGSTDGSVSVIDELHMRDRRVRLVALSRNYGHEAAMLAGIDHSEGDAVICMDGDMQHPPDLIPKMLAAWRAGSDVVLCVRTDNEESRLLHKWCSSLFHRLMNRLSDKGFQPNTSDFFLISRRVATILRTDFRERARFVRALLQSIGFRRSCIPFVAPPRPFGQSRYSFSALFDLSLNALFSFSNLPMRLGILAGICSGGFSLTVLAYSIVMKLLGKAPPGYSTIVVLITLLFAVQFFITGIIGEYIGILMVESKRRPIYLVDQIKYFQDGA